MKYIVSCVVLSLAAGCTQSPQSHPPKASPATEAPAEPAAMNLDTVAIATSESGTLTQIAAATPGSGWFCYEGLYKQKPISSSCHRGMDECSKHREDIASAFGSLPDNTYAACKARPKAYCFVVRVHAEFVPLALKTECAEERAACLSTRAVFAKNEKMEVGQHCVEAP
jgi:hypothetical protein